MAKSKSQRRRQKRYKAAQKRVVSAWKRSRPSGMTHRGKQRKRRFVFGGFI